MQARKHKVIPAKAGIKLDPRFREDDKDFLLEIGCEELPADYLPAALDWGAPASMGLSAAANVVFSKNRIVSKRIESFGTPRRLVLKVSGIEPTVFEEIDGPPVAIAFDAQGKPTEAAKGFAKKQGVSISQLKKKETSRGERLVLTRSIPVTKVLETAIPQIIQMVKFPKTMRWDDSGLRFARPIRWLLSLYGSQVVPCALGRLKSVRFTYGPRCFGNKAIAVKDASAYFAILRKLKVDLEEGWPFIPQKGGMGRADPEWGEQPSKRTGLHKLLEKKARSIGGELGDQKTEEFNWLLNTVTFLAEDPVVEVGSFRKEYLDLPPEVLATAMAKHLKLFSVYAPDGKKLLPQFLAILEGAPKNPALVMANVDRIIEARFSDARFFYQEDTKISLAAKVSSLEKVVFHEKLGSVADRIPRLERLSRAIAQQMEFSDSLIREIPRLVQLCKADLVTQMVREFPSLQGVIGAHYARHDGESEGVVEGIAQQYQPRTVADTVPHSRLGAIISLADRVDTLVGYFGAGMKPSGSLDPYGLRRLALGLVRILIEPPPGLSFVGLSIDRLFDEGIQSWGSKLKVVATQTLKEELRAFVRERLEWIAFVFEKFDQSHIEAVLAANDDDVAGAWERLKVLRQLWTDQKKKSLLIKAAKVAERTGRIVKAAKDQNGLGVVNPEVFKEPLEKQLWVRWNELYPTLADQIRRRDYQEAVFTYSTLYSQVHEFFEAVFVMDENPEIRRNRLALMHQIHQSLAGSFADLSKLPLGGIEP